MTILSFLLYITTFGALSFGGEIIDDAGTLVSVPNPQRIITLGDNLTEMMLILGLDKKIVGVSTNGQTDELHSFPKIELHDENVRGQISSLQPDVVIMEEKILPRRVLRALEKEHIKIVRLKKIKKTSDTLKQLRLLSYLMGIEKKGLPIIWDIQDHLFYEKISDKEEAKFIVEGKEISLLVSQNYTDTKIVVSKFISQDAQNTKKVRYEPYPRVLKKNNFIIRTNIRQ